MKIKLDENLPTGLIEVLTNVRRFAPGTHQGILLVRLSNPSRRHLIERLQEIFSVEAVEAWQQCFVVVTDLKIRIQRPN